MARFRDQGELTSPYVRVPDTRNYSGKRKGPNRGKHASKGGCWMSLLMVPVVILGIIIGAVQG